MRRTNVVVATAALLLAGTASWVAAFAEGSGSGDRKKEAPEVTLKGEVISLACYLDDGSKGEAHRACSAMTIQGGQPAALLTESGKVVLLLKPHGQKADFSGFAADMVEAKGVSLSRGGYSGLQVTSINKLAPPEPKKKDEGSSNPPRRREGS